MKRSPLASLLVVISLAAAAQTTSADNAYVLHVGVTRRGKRSAKPKFAILVRDFDCKEGWRLAF
jgi:hypothetical protein